MKKIKISPSVLSSDFGQLSTEIKKIEDAGADMIHVDVMDGHFVPNITIGAPVVKALRKHTSLPFDVHLMISPVHKYVKDFADAGADIITVHPEATDNLLQTIELIKSLGKKAGVSINPKTSLDSIFPVLHLIDLALIMSVNPGFGGQKFMPEVLSKVKILRQKIDEENLEVEIEIDGGINFDTGKLAKEAGVDILVSGTTLFTGNDGLKENIKKLRNC
jgi:ribulose-phosphate 3-epimerase